ncbi:hypothetical protein HPB50_028297 [Hyalomma asiaticum]|nr:hypothetical protein HPB50_028297 [Hyalomma asiaticum]
MSLSRPPTYHQLKPQLRWIPRDSTGGQDTVVERYRTFFQEQALLVDIDATFWMRNGRTKPVKKLHEQSISQIDVTIEWPDVAWLGAPAKYLQALINEANRSVELFLHLKIPAMLMGEAVNDIPPRPGRAATAAPIHWERHLALGCPCIGGPVHTASLCGALYLKLVFRDPFLFHGRFLQRCAHGMLFCYAPIQTYCPDAAAARRTSEVMIEDMIQFMCNYIKNDSIGILSNAHLAWADQEREAIHSQKCLSIAEKISICLDFAKNGKIAHLKRGERPHLYPDFMEKGSHKTTYRSDRALGVLYCTCRSLEAAVGNLGHWHVDPGRCQALAVPGWEGYRESVLQALAEYNANLRRILNQYGIGSEGEVMACMVNTFDTYHNAQSDKLNMEDLVEKMTTFLTVTTMDIFYADCLKEKHSSHRSDREELRKRKLRHASACYMATYESSTENSFFSFPWCITEVLIEILRRTGTQNIVWCPNILSWKITQFVKNRNLGEDDGLAAGCDTFKTAFGIIEEWLVKETLLGKHQPGAASMPGLCYNCLLGICSEFLRSRKLAPLEIVTRKWHIMMVSATPEAKDETAHEPVTEALNNLCVGRQNSTTKAPAEAWQIVDGVVEPHYFDDSEDENESPVMADQGGHGNNHEQDLQVFPHSLVFPLHEPPDDLNSETDLGEDTSVGTPVVSFLRWCLEQHRLPREACRVCACAGGGCDCQTHRLPMVAFPAYNSLAVSLDPCHISLPCDPAYHEPHQVIERDPVRIMVPNPVMDIMLKEKLDTVRQLLLRWTGIQDVQIQRQVSIDNTYIIVTALGRDWQVWFRQQLLLQHWLPEATDCAAWTSS